MSELDEDRRRALVRLLRRGGQTVITTTDLRYFSSEELADATVVELAPEGDVAIEDDGGVTRSPLISNAWATC